LADAVTLNDSPHQREPGSDDDDEKPAIDIAALRLQDAERDRAARIQAERMGAVNPRSQR
jgi:hypothetical protein